MIDVDFLRSVGVMDYSLLVGVRENHQRHWTKDMTSPFSGLKKTDSDLLLNHDIYLGIIDFLQLYDWSKWSETQMKQCIHPLSDISCVSPGVYADRFLRFIRESVFVTQSSLQSKTSRIVTPWEKHKK